MNIRASTHEDLPAIFDIYSQSKLDELSCEADVFTLLPLEQDKVRLDGLMESDIYVYQAQDCIYGYGAIFGSEIRALFVRPGFRGLGVGRKLLEYLLSLIAGETCLYVARSNRQAKRLYCSYGFIVTDTFETSYNQMAVTAQKMVRTAVPALSATENL